MNPEMQEKIRRLEKIILELCEVFDIRPSDSRKIMEMIELEALKLRNEND